MNISDVYQYLDRLKNSFPDVQSVGVVLMGDVLLIRVDWNSDVHASIAITKTELDHANYPLDDIFIETIENAYKKWEVGEE